MAKVKKSVTRQPKTGERVTNLPSVSFPCRVRSPLGYIHLQPEDDRSFDQAVVDSMLMLHLSEGNRVIVTITVRTEDT